MNNKYTDVELPLINQLVGMGGHHLAGDRNDSALSGHLQVAEVIREAVLLQALPEWSA